VQKMVIAMSGEVIPKINFSIIMFLLTKVFIFNYRGMDFLSYSPISPVLPTNLSTAFWDN